LPLSCAFAGANPSLPKGRPVAKILHLPDISGCWFSLLCARHSGNGSIKGERKKLGERSSSDREAAFRAERAKMYEFAATTGLLDKIKQEAEDRD